MENAVRDNLVRNPTRDVARRADRTYRKRMHSSSLSLDDDGRDPPPRALVTLLRADIDDEGGIHLLS
jgi:hypothetical protein